MRKGANPHASCRSFAARSRRPSAPPRVDPPGPPLDEPITPIGPARQVGVVGRDQEGDAALGLEPCEQIVNNLASLRRSEEHTSELQSQSNLVCRLLLEKKKKNTARVVTNTASK